jgi:hypothetical protein
MVFCTDHDFDEVVVEGAVVMTIEDANIAAMREIFRAHIINRRDSGS